MTWTLIHLLVMGLHGRHLSHTTTPTEMTILRLHLRLRVWVWLHPPIQSRLLVEVVVDTTVESIRVEVEVEEEEEVEVETVEVNEKEAEVEEEGADIEIRTSTAIVRILLLSLTTLGVIPGNHHLLRPWLSHVRLDKCLIMDRNINTNTNNHFLPCTQMLMEMKIRGSITMCSPRLNSNNVNMGTCSILINHCKLHLYNPILTHVSLLLSEWR
jgi:hypothetical protein